MLKLSTLRVSLVRSIIELDQSFVRITGMDLCVPAALSCHRQYKKWPESVRRHCRREKQLKLEKVANKGTIWLWQYYFYKLGKMFIKLVSLLLLAANALSVRAAPRALEKWNSNADAQKVLFSIENNIYWVERDDILYFSSVWDSGV